MSTSLEVLSKAIQNHQPGVISVRDGGVTNQIEVCFGEEAHEEGMDGFWALMTSGSAKLVDLLVQSQSTIEVAFNTDSATVFFDSALLKKKRQWFKQQLLLKRPEQVSIVERRKGNRELVPHDVEVTGRISPTKQTEGTVCDIAARVWDVSPTGASFLCRADQPLPKMEVGEPLAITLIFNGGEHRLTACHRYTQRLSSSSVKLGVQYDAEAVADPSIAARYQQLLEEIQSLNIRRSFRNTLRNRFSWAPN